jgi:hypothetical protein
MVNYSHTLYSELIHNEYLSGKILFLIAYLAKNLQRKIAMSICLMLFGYISELRKLSEFARKLILTSTKSITFATIECL